MIARLRRRREEDGGFALLFVIMVTTVVMLGVGTALTVTTPNITGARTTQDDASAGAAAQSAVDDAVAYLSSIASCRSETRVCPQALGAHSMSLGRPTLGTNQQFCWDTGSAVTSDGYVRMTARGNVGGTMSKNAQTGNCQFTGGATRTLTADLSLQPSILSFGYYTDYESQSPDFLYDYFAPRTVDITKSSTYGQINAYNTSGRTISVTSPTTVSWAGPPTSGNNPYPASICGQHWYSDGSSSPGRYSTASNGVSLWGETGTINSNKVIRTSGCDVVFTSGMVENGPIYTRDALYISDAGGTGPIFDQPVYSLWGYPGYNTPAPPASPWRTDPSAGGTISSKSPYKPQIASADLTLPKDIGDDGIPANACVYTGPTRAVLQSNGTALITSPETTSRNPASDSGCYPTGSLAGGIINFTLNPQSSGAGTIYVQDANTPANGWPENPTKSTQTPSASNEIFYLPSTTGGSTTPDQADTAAAPSTGCKVTVTGSGKNQTTTTVNYSSQNSWPCAWTNVTSATDSTSSTGWTSSAAKSCSTLKTTPDPLEENQFDCDVEASTSSSGPTADEYAKVRSSLQTQISSGLCTPSHQTGTSTTASCLVALANTAVQAGNTGHAAITTKPSSNTARQYYAAVTATGTPTTGASKSFGATPTNPMAGDNLFTFTGNQAQETPTEQTYTVTVYRQVSNSGGTAWQTGVPQFTFTVTQDSWAVTQQASGAAYFPNPADATKYDTGANATGTAAGSTGTAQPGDLYVEGVNNGRLSLIAENNVEITGDLTDNGTTGSDTQAVDITAGNNVRNYHPVTCVDQTAADINATSPGWCPNDITGLSRNTMISNGAFTSDHPAAQYTNLAMTNGATSGTRTIDAAIFALDGSFLTDNYDRGSYIGNLNVNGGIYQSHRGANGVQYSSGSTVVRTGYNLNYSYVDLEHANLPYAPPATSGGNTRVWNVVSISAGT